MPIRWINVRACMPPVLQKNECRSVDWTMRWPPRVKSGAFTAGEDETSEGNPENSKRDAVDVAPSPPAPEDEAAAEPTTTEPATAEPATAEPAKAEPATAEPATTETTTAEPTTAKPARR